ncbi:hypothetical protein KKB28_09100 [bacterium]|nr:hypothetical protein [bacterium]
MKRSIRLIIVLLFGASSLFAQEFAVDKKAMLISGSIAFSSSGGDLYVIGDKRLTEINLTMTFDYFIARQVIIGLPLTFHRKYIGDYNFTATIGIGPEIGYVYGKEKSQVLPYAKIGYQYVVMSSENFMTAYEYGAIGDGVQTDVIFSLGTLLLLQKHIGINPQISYHFQKHEADDGYYSSSYSYRELSQSGNVLRFSIGLTGLLY